MGEVLVAVVVMLVLAGIAVAAEVWLNNRTHPTAEARDDKLMRRYDRLVERAAEETRKGHVGEANVFTEAAERLLEAWKGQER